MIKKIVIGIIGLLIIAIVGVAIFVTLMLDRTVKTAIETIGPKITGTKVTVESVNISLLSGVATIRGLYVGNPEGFSSEKAFSFGEVHVDLDTGSIFKDVVVVEEIRIVEPQFVFERDLKGSNLDKLRAQINQNLAKYQSGSSQTPSGQDTGESKRFIIDDFQLTGASVDLRLLGQGGTVSLPAITLQNIGKSAGGITPDQAAGEILGTVLDQVAAAAIKMATDVLKSGQGLGSEAKDAAGGLLNTVKGLFDK